MDEEIGIRCTDTVWRRRGAEGNLDAWNRRFDQLDDDCSCGAGGIVMRPTSFASSTGSRRARVAAQYLGASSM